MVVLVLFYCCSVSSVSLTYIDVSCSDWLLHGGSCVTIEMLIRGTDRTEYGYSTVMYGTVAQLLALPPHSKKVMGSIPTWGAVGSGGQVLPRVLHSAQVGYLPGLSVWSLHVLPVFTRGSLH